MEPLNFRTAGGRLVWENIRDSLDLFCGAETYHEMTEATQADAKIRLVTLIFMAAFRHEFPESLTHKDYFIEVMRKQITVCQDTFRLHTLDYESERIIIFDADGHPLLQPIGRIDGFTSVFPLTEAAFEHFAETAMASEDFDERHILADGLGPRPHPYLYIGGIVHLPSLAGDKKQIDSSTTPLSRHLFEHAASWTIPFDHDEQLDLFVPRTGNTLPKLICLRDGREMADAFIIETGFEPHGQRDELTGMQKYLLDFSLYQHKDKQTRKRMVNACRLLKIARNSWTRRQRKG